MISEIGVEGSVRPRKSVSLIEVPTDLAFISDTVRRINEAPLSELESKMPEFIERRDQNAFVLGGILERIRREKFWNPGSRRPQNALFEHWVEETCHYSGRKARYLISVYVGLVQAAVPSSKISGVGWSKLRMIAPLLKPIQDSDENANAANKAHNDELLRLARRKSRRALEAALKTVATGAHVAELNDQLEHKPKQYVFKVKHGAELVDAALEKIAVETGHTGGAALVDMARVVAGAGMLPMRGGDGGSAHLPNV